MRGHALVSSRYRNGKIVAGAQISRLARGAVHFHNIARKIYSNPLKVLDNMSLVEFETHGPIALIRLNRPDQRNAVNMALMAELTEALARLEAEADLVVGILTGAGKIFCAGMDLAAFAAGERPGITDPEHFAGFVSRKRTKPIIAAVNGGAIAGGFEIVLACDMVIAEQGAIFSLPEVKRGIIAAGGGAFRLPRRLPAAIANEILLTGDSISAERALAFGLVNEVVPGSDLVAAALKLAARIAVNAPLALQLTLDMARNSVALAEAEAWAASDAAWGRIDVSEDALEGARAFKEKRPPVWKYR
jgi:enoyl-CoA hydratase/carnithine racemase